MPSTSEDTVARERTAVLWLLSAVGVWGLSFPAGRALAIAIPHLTGVPLDFPASAVICAVRYLLAAIAILALPQTRVRITRSELLQGIALGIPLAGAVTLFQFALGIENASSVAFISQMYLVIVVAVGHFSTRNWPTRRTLLAVILAILGTATISGLTLKGLHFDVGSLPVLVGAGLAAIQILVLDSPRFAGNRPEPVTCIMFAFAGAIMLCAMVAPSGRAAANTIFRDPACLELTAFIAIVLTVFPFLTMIRYQPLVSPIRASMIYILEPVVSAVSALFMPAWISQLTKIDYPNEKWTSRLLIGAILILGGNLLLRKPHSSANSLQEPLST